MKDSTCARWESFSRQMLSVVAISVEGGALGSADILGEADGIKTPLRSRHGALPKFAPD
jgi:hypothetical protein